VGIRTPWTLEDPENWKATHRMGSKVFFWGGLAIALAGLILGRPEVIYVCVFGLLAVALVPVVFSFLYFRKNKPRN
jgi:uncharacterized membrane protein